MDISDGSITYLADNPSLNVRVRLYFRQRGRCYWCERQLLLGPKWTRPKSVTEDHFTARVYGGKSTMTNLVGACWRCNSLRQELSGVFFKHLTKLYGRRLPEYGTPEFSALQRSIRQCLDGKRIRVRVPAQHHAIVCETVLSNPNMPLSSDQ